MTRTCLFFVLCFPAVSQTAPELVVGTGHAGFIRQIAFTSDGRTLLSSGDDGFIRFWDAERGTFLRKIAAHSGSVNEMAACPDGSIIASAGADGMFRVWAFDTGRMLGQSRADSMSRLAWLGDCRHIAVSGGTAIAIVDLKNFADPPKVLRVEESIVALRYLPDRRMLIAGTGYSNSLLAWKSDTWEPLPRLSTGPQDRPDSLISSENGSAVVSFTSRSLTVLDTETLKPMHRLPNDREVDAAALSSDGALLLTADTGKMTIWSLDLQKKFEITGGGVAAAWSPDGKRIGVGDVYGHIQIFDATPGSKRRLEIPGGGVVVGNLQFTESGALRVFGAVRNAARIWDIGPIEVEQSLPGAMLSVVSSTAGSNGSYLTVFSAQQLIWWDLEPLPVPHEVSTQSINGWPLSCHPDGRCAWEESGKDGNWIAVADVRHGGAAQRLPLQSETAVAIAFNPDGSALAVATNQPHVRVWSLPKGIERAPLVLEPAAPGQSLAGTYLQRLATRKLMIVHPDMATAVQFSPNGKLLAAGNANAMHLWETSGFSLQKNIAAAGSITGLTFGPDGDFSYSTENGDVRVLSLSGKASDLMLNAGPETPELLVFHPNGSVLAATNQTGIVLWDLRKRSILARIEFTDGGSWVAVTPGGAFDATGRAWEAASWRLNGNTRSLIPLETYARDYFAPGLIADLLAGREVKPRKPFEQLDRNLPKLELVALEKYVPGAGKIHVRINVAANGAQSASDLHIYRNGRLIHKVDGVLSTGNKRFSRDLEILLVPGDNEITATAFNEDGLRSEMTRLSLPETRSAYPTVITTLHVLAIGINEYVDSGLHLRFAAADAESVAAALNFSEEVIRKAGQSRPVNISLSGPPSALAGKTSVHLLKDGEATRGGILGAIRQVSAEAAPTDTVVMFYAGHSLADGDRFYLLPHDARVGASSTYISDEDLEKAMASLDVAHIALILDSCNSGKVVDARDRRGPLNSRGLARLTFEKAMFVLTASQTNEEAREETGLEHGLLTYALVDEGIEKWRADAANTGEIELGAWLRYGASRVPSLARASTEQHNRGARPSVRSAVRRQTPQFVPDPLEARERVLLRVKTTANGQ